jgi:hypothetical protein
LTTGSGNNFVAADNVTATYSRAAGESVAGSPYHITATLSATGDLNNYNITNNGADFNINLRVAKWITNPNSKVFANPDPNPLTTGSGVNFLLSDGVSATYSRVAGEAPGPYAITATLSAAVPGALSNYMITNAGSTFTITNVAPSNITVAPTTINENSSAVIAGSFTDLDPGQSHTVTINWGEGSPTVLSLGVGVTTFGASHQYRDDNPTGTPSDTYSLSISVSDGASSGTGASTVQVNNVAPVISSFAGPSAPQAVGDVSNVTATFSDVGTLDTHTCSINWDDGSTTTGTVTESAGSGTCTGSHTFASAGVYSASVTITDDDTGAQKKPLDLQYIVIFDPNAGFVTGGGWINSPIGACQLTAACATQTGKANFGFVSKYKKGSNTPDGQTEFQFQAGDLDFHSSSYDVGSLVVSGYKAQYKGTGDINGVDGYKFVLTAYDGDVNGGGGIDKFRIKITKNGVVVYDNRIGASDDIDLANPTAIAGGSIVIHK